MSSFELLPDDALQRTDQLELLISQLAQERAQAHAWLWRLAYLAAGATALAAVAGFQAGAIFAIAH